MSNDDELTNYLREIARYPLLTPDAEIELGRKVAAGQHAAGQLAAMTEPSPVRRAELERIGEEGQRARTRLVESNLRLVVSIARRYTARGLSLLDLIQEGNIGLQTGIDKFDWRKGFRLSTYVYWRIRQAITRALANDSRLIRLPVHVGELFWVAGLTEQQLAIELGREPTLEELAHRVGMDPDRLQAIRQAAASPRSLDAPLLSDGDVTRGELVPDEAALEAMHSSEDAHALSASVAVALEHLAPRERDVLRLRFGLGQPGPCTLAEVGARLGLTRERARQIESQALRKLRGDVRLRRALVELASA